MSARANFRRLQNHRITASQRYSDGPNAQDDWRVPRRDTEDNAGRFAYRHGQAPWFVGRNDLTGDLRGQRCRLSDYRGGQCNVESGPSFGRPDFSHHRLDELSCLRFDRNRRLGQESPSGVRSERAPPGQGGLGSVGNGDRLRNRHRRRARCHFTGNRIEPLKRCNGIGQHDDALCWSESVPNLPNRISDKPRASMKTPTDPITRDCVPVRCRRKMKIGGSRNWAMKVAAVHRPITLPSTLAGTTATSAFNRAGTINPIPSPATAINAPVAQYPETKATPRKPMPASTKPVVVRRSQSIRMSAPELVAPVASPTAPQDIPRPIPALFMAPRC